MKKGLLATLAFALIIAAPLAAQDQTTEVMTLDKVVEMSKAGLSDETIINAVISSEASIVLTVKDILYLKEQGVSEDVINFLLRRQPQSGMESTEALPAEEQGQELPPYVADAAEGNYYDGLYLQRRLRLHRRLRAAGTTATTSSSTTTTARGCATTRGISASTTTPRPTTTTRGGPTTTITTSTTRASTAGGTTTTTRSTTAATTGADATTTTAAATSAHRDGHYIDRWNRPVGSYATTRGSTSRVSRSGVAVRGRTTTTSRSAVYRGRTTTSRAPTREFALQFAVAQRAHAQQNPAHPLQHAAAHQQQPQRDAA